MGSHNGSIHNTHTPLPLLFYNTFKDMNLVIWKYAHVFNHSRSSYHVSGGLAVCANAPKHVFNHYRRLKVFFSSYHVSGGL
jgi:hypothetical protein